MSEPSEGECRDPIFCDAVMSELGSCVTSIRSKRSCVTVGGLRALEDLTGVAADMTIHVENVEPVTHQPAHFDELANGIGRGNPEMRRERDKLDAPATEEAVGGVALLSSSLSCVASTVAKSLVTVMSLGLSKRSPTDRLSGHSGNPALRRLSMKRTRSSARRSGGATRSRLPSLNAGSTSRKQAIAARASTIRSERALAVAATRSAVAQFGCSWRALVAQDIASS